MRLRTSMRWISVLCGLVFVSTAIPGSSGLVIKSTDHELLAGESDIHPIFKVSENEELSEEHDARLLPQLRAEHRLGSVNDMVLSSASLPNYRRPQKPFRKPQQVYKRSHRPRSYSRQPVSLQGLRRGFNRAHKKKKLPPRHSRRPHRRAPYVPLKVPLPTRNFHRRPPKTAPPALKPSFRTNVDSAGISLGFNGDFEREFASGMDSFDFDNSIFLDVNDSHLVSEFTKESEKEARELMQLGEYGKSLIRDDSRDIPRAPDFAASADDPSTRTDAFLSFQPRILDDEQLFGGKLDFTKESEDENDRRFKSFKSDSPYVGKGIREAPLNADGQRDLELEDYYYYNYDDEDFRDGGGKKSHSGPSKFRHKNYPPVSPFNDYYLEREGKELQLNDQDKLPLVSRNNLYMPFYDDEITDMERELASDMKDYKRHKMEVTKSELKNRANDLLRDYPVVYRYPSRNVTAVIIQEEEKKVTKGNKSSEGAKTMADKKVKPTLRRRIDAPPPPQSLEADIKSATTTNASLSSKDNWKREQQTLSQPKCPHCGTKKHKRLENNWTPRPLHKSTSRINDVNRDESWRSSSEVPDAVSFSTLNGTFSEPPTPNPILSTKVDIGQVKKVLPKQSKKKASNKPQKKKNSFQTSSSRRHNRGHPGGGQQHHLPVKVRPPPRKSALPTTVLAKHPSGSLVPVHLIPPQEGSKIGRLPRPMAKERGSLSPFQIKKDNIKSTPPSPVFRPSQRDAGPSKNAKTENINALEDDYWKKGFGFDETQSQQRRQDTQAVLPASAIPGEDGPEHRTIDDSKESRSHIPGFHDGRVHIKAYRGPNQHVKGDRYYDVFAPWGYSGYVPSDNGYQKAHL